MEGNLDRTLKEIKLAFVEINKHMFGGRLPEPVLIVQSSKRALKNAMGWFSFGKQWVDRETGQRFNEITICAETLTKPLRTVLAVLVHEMVHLYNSMNGVNDCSASQYHNRRFKAAAEKFFLKTNEVPDKKYGYGITEPTQKLIDFLEMIGIDEDAFNVGLSDAQPDRKEYFMFVYVCDKCGRGFKTSADLAYAVHTGCGGNFEKKE